MVFILPILAVVTCFIFVYLIRPKSEKNINLFLAFSGAFLLALTFFELLPSVYENTNSKNVTIFILAGILLQVFLEFFSKGAEHGHVHISLKANSFPIVLCLSLSIHALIEGIPITKDNNILVGVLIHKIPVAIILSIFLLNSKLTINYILLFIGLFALMTPLGSFLALESSLVSKFSNELTALAIGVFFHVSTVVLFESAKGHSFNLGKLMVIILGFSVAYFL